MKRIFSSPAYTVTASQPGRKPEHLVIYYDEEYDLDTWHVDLIVQHPDFTRAPCPSTMHNVLWTWYRQNQLQEKLREVI